MKCLFFFLPFLAPNPKMVQAITPKSLTTFLLRFGTLLLTFTKFNQLIFKLLHENHESMDNDLEMMMTTTTATYHYAIEKIWSHIEIKYQEIYKN